jgi:recombination protein RecA
VAKSSSATAVESKKGAEPAFATHGASASGVRQQAPTAPRDANRDSALSRAVQQIEKQFGKGAVMTLDREKTATIDGIPTGSLSLDIALGGSGVPKGRILEIFGPESSGKTTLTLHIIASAQKTRRRGGVRRRRTRARPVVGQAARRQLDDLLVSQPDTGEQALEICRTARALQRRRRHRHRLGRGPHPRAEIEGEMGDSHVGLQAR